MAQQYFTREHFELLKKWKGVKYDKTNPEQKRVYEELQRAYEVTEVWAQALQRRHFPEGHVVLRKSPINQGQNYFGYNWARIYPSPSAPKELAYTVGISAESGFIVKIDTVSLDDSNPVRTSYIKLRGADVNKAPFVATLPADQGLDLDMGALLDWSAAAIDAFKLDYDEVVKQLGLPLGLDRDALLQHFIGHSKFSDYQSKWGDEMTGLFVSFANTVHQLGWDWYLTETERLHFGRKDKGFKKGSIVGWLIFSIDKVSVQWGKVGKLAGLPRSILSPEVIKRIAAAKLDGEELHKAYLPRENGVAYWPTDYSEAETEVESGIEEEPAAPYRMDVSPKNKIYYGPPGTGKTYELQQSLRTNYADNDGVKRYEFVTFHQSFGYEEFIEGLRPVIGKNDDPQAGQVHYEIKPGAFLRLCERARQDKSRKYVMFIDEINRGNISKIFGELITLLEADKRDGGENRLEITLPYSQTPFSVPWKVDVIGTMNTADRSLALMDTALRRRFDFSEVMPDPEVLEDISIPANGAKIEIAKILSIMNQRIEALYDREHTIGHAYLTPLLKLKDQPEAEQLAALKNIFKNRIIPLLEEYFFDDWHKIRLVLGDNQKDIEEFQFVKKIGLETDALNLFGNNTDLDQYQLTTRYQRNPFALDKPLAYIGIYDPNATKAAKPA